ncbi:LLM class flavin-dependent oxidoreductase [Thermobifida alba]|uniref:Alkanesulfonate monooxygenase n=2 Tax=Thermobifida TaxID=83677 RepID=A0A147KII1_THECS|nr:MULTISPECIES: LLM class flavin-dependent oxidoreductase [Thermobifida]KUP97088.1 alkanesulfonate monooxygenase [Thermobifida cellulosilytica TB100]UPT20408.1 LLM class flavin-dependent oxidoreductase [Thermobifida alba]
MSLTFHWFLPTQGDSRGIVDPVTETASAWRSREPSFGYLLQVARAAEQLGFEGVLTPTGAWCEDAWVTTASLLGTVQRLKFLVAFRPGLVSPTLAAQMAATYQRLSGGRLLLNVVTGGESAEQRAYGDFLDKEERYARTDEFLRIVTRLWEGRTVDFSGEHLVVEGAALHRPPDPRPRLYFGGSSPAALRVAARRVDTYLTWGEPPAAVADKLDRVRQLAAEAGRSLEYGIRLHVITRDTSAEAWREAERLLERLPADTVAQIQAGLARSESEGQRRMLALHGGRRDNLEVHPNLWAGVGLARGGAGTALVGSHTEVADRIEEYHRLGITEFVLSGYPHLEEAYWFGEGVLPLLRRRGLWQHPGAGPEAASAHVPFLGAPRVPAATT